MKKKFLLHMLFIVVALAAVLITANQKVEVFNNDDLRTLSCGWPFKFVVNNQSHLDPPFPWKIPCLDGEWDYATRKFFHWSQFIIDILVFYVLIVFFRGTYIILSNKMQ